MKAAPLIYSRLKNVDFNQNFLVRPKDLPDVTWARNKILPSIRDIEILNGFRRVVAVKGNICIAGISGYFEDFIKNYVPEVEIEAEKFFTEKRGRNIKLFIGYVFEGEGVPNISYKKLWQMFNEHVAEIWEYESPTTIYSIFENCETKSVPVQPSGKVGTFCNVECYNSGKDIDEKIFEWCQLKKLDFCSNVNQFDIVEDGKYKIITASQNVINRLKNEEEKVKAQKLKEQQEKENLRRESITQKKTDKISSQTPITVIQPKKKKTPIFLIAAVVIVIIAIIFLTGANK